MVVVAERRAGVGVRQIYRVRLKAGNHKTRQRRSSFRGAHEKCLASAVGRSSLGVFKTVKQGLIDAMFRWCVLESL